MGTTAKTLKRHHAAVPLTVGLIWRHPANRGRRLRRLARFVAIRGFGRFTGRPAAVRFGERSKILVRLDNSSASIVLRSPVPDWAEMQVWKRHLQPGDLFVDVGAHLGAYSIWAIEQGASVVAVEADPLMARFLRSNLELNGYDAEVHAVGAADRSGVMSLAGPDQSRQALAVGGGVGKDVPVETLDALVGGRSVSGPKIDVEGAERLVLEGAQALLSGKRIRLVQVEWNSLSLATLGEDRASVATILVDAGYELLRPDDNGDLFPTDARDFGSDVFARLVE